MDKVKKNKLIVNGMYILFILSFLFLVSELLICYEKPSMIKIFLFISLVFIFIATTTIIFMYVRLSNSKTEELSQTASMQTEDFLEEDTRDDNVEQDIAEHAKKENYIALDFNKILSDNRNYESKEVLCNTILINIAKQLELVKGILYLKSTNSEDFLPLGTYAYYDVEPPRSFIAGEGLSGQVVRDRKPIYITDIPEKYLNIVSGLGTGNPKYLLLLPLVVNDVALGLIEIASFKPLNFDHDAFISFLSGKLVNIVNKFK